MGPYRSLWRATVSFGLVSIPVKMYAAAEDRELHLRQLHRRCHSPIRYRKWCPACDVAVPEEELAWGYEVAPGQFVEVSEGELEELPGPEAHVIQILDFVPPDQVDPLYFDRPYYLEPAEAAARAYRVLAEAMGRAGRVAIARFALRRREHLAALRPYGPVLALVTLRWADELRAPEQVVQLPAGGQPTAREQEVAIELVRRLTARFEPGRYVNQRREAFRELVERKAAQAPPVRPPAPPPAPFADLLEALEASLRAHQPAEPGPDAPASRDGKAPARVGGRRRG